MGLSKLIKIALFSVGLVLLPVNAIADASLPTLNETQISEVELLAGKWQGPMDIQGSHFDIEVTFNDQEPLAGAVKLNVATSRSAIPMRNIETDGQNVFFELNASPANFEFEGSIVDGKISGNVTLLHMKGTFSLERAETAE